MNLSILLITFSLSAKNPTLYALESVQHAVKNSDLIGIFFAMITNRSQPMATFAAITEI